jgi:transposase
MGQRSIIWKNKLENYIADLFYKQRKTFKEIAEIIQKEKGISISAEAVRNHFNK